MFVHVSTAYANCDQEVTVEERIYPPVVDPEILSSSIGFVLFAILLVIFFYSCIVLYYIARFER